MHAEIVSVLIPTYNRAEFLPESVDAVLTALRAQDEVIVIDDGSTDDTPQILARYGNRIRVITTPNRGKSTALNIGLTQAKGDYVWIVDDDDLVLPDALTRLLGMLQANPQAGLAYGRYETFSTNEHGERAFHGTGHWAYHVSPKAFLAETLDDFFVHQPGMLVRREVYDRTGPFNEALSRSIDYEMLVRIARLTEAVGTDEVVFLQRQHNGDRGPASARIKGRQRWAIWAANNRRIFRKFHDRLPLEAYTAGPVDLNNPLSRRAALLRRGVVMARHQNWDLALANFRLAADMAIEPLTPSERKTVRTTFNGTFGCRDVLDDDRLISDFCALSDNSVGASLLVIFARSLKYRVREALERGEWQKAAGYAVATLRLLGAAAVGHAGWHPAPATAE